MLRHGRMPLSAEENAAVDRLIAEHGDEVRSLTRRDPGESGPLLVHVGDDTYVVAANGRTKKEK